MISVRELDDIQYVKDLLTRPGMGKLCSGDGSCIRAELVDSVVENYPTKFVLVDEDGERRGFVAFVQNELGAHFIHVALQTRGQKTLEALTKALDYAHEVLGIDEVHAVYPDRESIEHLADDFGFTRHGKVDSGRGFELNHISKTFND